MRWLKLRIVKRGVSFGAAASVAANGETLLWSTSASNFVQENCDMDGVSVEACGQNVPLDSTHRVALVDVRTFDVEPTWTHDLAVDDKALEGRRCRAKDMRVHLAGRVNGDVRLVTLADYEGRGRVSADMDESGVILRGNAPGKSQETSSQSVSFRGTPLIPKAYRRLT